MTRSPWNSAENRETVRSYLTMLEHELLGRSFTKSEFARHLVESLSNTRTKGAVGMKHSNISAVLEELGLPYIQSYKPLSNYQSSLKETVLGLLDGAEQWRLRIVDAQQYNSDSSSPSQVSTTDQGGYILIAEPHWIDSHDINSPKKISIYCRSTDAPMHSVPVGIPIFFVKPNEMPRCIHAYGLYLDSRTTTVHDLWKHHCKDLNCDSFESFRNSLGQIGDSEPDSKIYAVWLQDLVRCTQSMALENADISFLSQAVKSVGLSIKEANTLLMLLNSDVEMDAETETDPKTYLENVRRLREHKRVERTRSQAAVKRAKADRLEQDPLLRCDACSMSFRERYGDMVDQYIEAHHKSWLSEIEEPVRTKTSDFDMLCANCHRVVHLARISTDDLKTKIFDAGR